MIPARGPQTEFPVNIEGQAQWAKDNFGVPRLLRLPGLTLSYLRLPLITGMPGDPLYLSWAGLV